MIIDDIITFLLNVLMFFIFLSLALRFYKKYLSDDSSYLKNLAIGFIVICFNAVFHSAKALIILFKWEKFFPLNDRFAELTILFVLLFVLTAFAELFHLSKKLIFWFNCIYILFMIIITAYIYSNYEPAIIRHVGRILLGGLLGFSGLGMIYRGFLRREKGFILIGTAMVLWLFQGVLEVVLLATGHYSQLILTIIGLNNTVLLVWGFNSISRTREVVDIRRRQSEENYVLSRRGIG